MKKLLKSLREYTQLSIITPILVLLEVFLEVLIPFQMAKIIDVGIKNNDVKYILKIGIILFIMSTLALIFGALAGKTAAIASAGFAKNLRKDAYYNLQNYSFKNIDKFSVSSIVTRLTTDITNIQMAFMLTIRLLIRTPFMIILSLFMTWKINKDIAIIFVFIIPFLALCLFLIAKNAKQLFSNVFKKYDDLNKTIQENVNASRVVKAYVREEFEINKFQKKSQNVYELFVKAEKLVALNSPLMEFTIYIAILFMLAIGGKSIVFGEMQIGQLSSVIVYAIQILISMMMVTFVFIMIIISEASRERLIEILDEKSDIVNKENSINYFNKYDIEFNNVSFSYDNNPKNLSLHNINLKIEEGQTIGIIGATGSSKTTLVQLMSRLYDVTSGELKIGGINVKDYNLETLRNNVAMVLQKNILFSGSITENIKWGNESATFEEVKNVCELAMASSFIDEFPDKYETQIVQGGNNVSGGQKQRLCIARTLLKKPKILILDDSTSAVDTKTEAIIRKNLKNIFPDTTKIIISQRISSIEDSDLIIVMEDGKIESLGTSKELLEKSNIYKQIFESQTKEGDINE